MNLRNIFETKEGRRTFIALATVSIVLIGLLFFSQLKSEGKVEQTVNTETTNKKNSSLNAKGAIYSGVWITNKESEGKITLKNDLTYIAENDELLSSGTYHLTDHSEMIFDDKKEGKVTFQLQMRYGQTVMYSNERNRDLMLFSSKELKEKVVENYSSKADEVDQMIDQKWIDVLEQGLWTSTEAEMAYSMEFKEDKVIQKKKEGEKGKEEERTFSYRIIEQIPKESGCTFVLSKTDEAGNVFQVSFNVQEEDNKYVLQSTPGIFNWTSKFYKNIENVQLTQQGVTKDEGTN